MYQIGQAVINYCHNGNTFIDVIHTVRNGTAYTRDLFLDHYGIYNPKYRFATEAEILAEAAKHGWVQDEWRVIDSPNKYLSLVKVSEKWIRNSILTPSDDNLAIFGNECIVADRLIKALNLAK